MFSELKKKTRSSTIENPPSPPLFLPPRRHHIRPSYVQGGWQICPSAGFIVTIFGKVFARRRRRRRYPTGRPAKFIVETWYFSSVAVLLLFADSACEKIIKATTTDLDPAADVLRMRYRRRRRRRRHGPSDGHIQTHTQRCTSPLRRRLFDSSTDHAAPIARVGSGVVVVVVLVAAVGGGGDGYGGGSVSQGVHSTTFALARAPQTRTHTRTRIHMHTHM